jgi:hypothetical protein
VEGKIVLCIDIVLCIYIEDFTDILGCGNQDVTLMVIKEVTVKKKLILVQDAGISGFQATGIPLREACRYIKTVLRYRDAVPFAGTMVTELLPAVSG